MTEPADKQDNAFPSEGGTVPSERDAKRLLEVLDRSEAWNARLARSLETYRAATQGDPTRPFDWPARGRPT